MKVVAMGVMVGVVGRMVVVVLLLGVRKRLQEHVLWGNWAKRDETSSGA